MVAYPEPFMCHHNESDEIREISIPEDRGYVTHYKCMVCGSMFPVIGDTDMWKPIMVYPGELDWEHTL